MKIFLRTIILFLFFACIHIIAKTTKEFQISTNSPVEAGKTFKLIITPSTDKHMEFEFNGETHVIPYGLKLFNASENALPNTKIIADNKSAWGKSVCGTNKYQSIVSIKFPQDAKAYSIWVRVKGGALCLRNYLKGKSKEMKWNWICSESYSWRYFGNYTNTQTGTNIIFMTKDNNQPAVIDSVLLTTDKNYIPEKKCVVPTLFTWQTNVSSTGSHEMLVTADIEGKKDTHKIKVEILPYDTKNAPANDFIISKETLVNIPLGDSTQSAASYPDFNIFNQTYRDFFSQPHLGIVFPVKPEFMALKCQKYPQLPEEVKIPVKKKLAGLAFLHTEYWQGEVGQKIAFYRIKYSDSTTLDIPIREEFEIAGSLRSSKTQNAIALFKAYSKAIDFHMALFIWKNPHPDKKIENITFSNRLSRFSKEENKIIPLNVTSMSSQILINIFGIKDDATVNRLLVRQSSKSYDEQQEVFATVDFGKVVGKISPYLFGTNETGIMNTDIPEFKAYGRKMAKIGCRIFRLHSGWRPENVYPKGIKGPKLYKDLDAGIRNILKEHPERVIMICINAIPKYIDPLKEKDREHFAAICADLLKHFKKENIPVKYWEIYNEAYFNGVKEDRSLWKMYNLTAEKLKAIDPTIKIGGYAPCWPTISGIRDFYQHCHRNVDFLSWHKYPTGSSKTSDSYIMSSANSFGKDAQGIREMVEKITPGKKIEYALTEYNINWNWKPHDPRQANNKGAVWLASVLYHLILENVDIATTWHSRSGGTFGLISDKNEVRPTAELLYLCNRYLIKTNYVMSKTNDKNLECLGLIQSGKYVGILLINKNNKFRQVKISNLSLPHLPDKYFEGNALEYTIGTKGLSRQKSNIGRKMELSIGPYEIKIVIASINCNKITSNLSL